jgi:drug/metabolite transporter (DMT)-like permease
MTRVPYLGEICALASPLLWSLAIILFRRTGRSVPPLPLNLFKNVLGLVLFTATLVLVSGPAERGVAGRTYLMLLASGALGIGLADTFFFMTLNRVGAALQAILTTLYSPSIIVLSTIFLGETLAPLQVFGVALILGAVLSVGFVRGPREPVPRRTLWAGMLYGIAATSTQAVSIVMIKPILEESPLIWASCWRLVGGVLTTAVLLPLLPGEMRNLRALADRRIRPVMISASVIGSYLSLMVWLAGMKYTQASIASALNQTATLWTFLLAALLLKEPVTLRRLAGLALGAGGVAFVTFGG